MRRVVHVTAGGERGGLEVVLLNLLRCLDRSRFEPLVVLLEEGPFGEEIAAAGAEVEVIPAGRVRSLAAGIRALFNTARLIRERRVDIVHTLNAKAHLYGGSAATLARVPCLYHLHGVPAPHPSRDGLVSLLSVLVPAQRTVACSRYVAETFGQVWRSRRDVIVVHNGVTLYARANQDGATEVRDELGVPHGAPLVVMACRLQRWKGVHVFVEAAAPVARACPEARFAVVGGTLLNLEPDYALELRAQAERLGLGDSLRFTGYRPDAKRFLASADVVVHASIEPEPFGMVIAEAMALGRPVVATDLGGPREIVEDGVSGVLVPPNSAAHMAEAILGLLRAPERRTRIGEAAVLRIQHDFTAEQMARRFEALYEQLAAQAR
jgi:glycosyltransferase involved in cell wall biosynthesis